MRLLTIMVISVFMLSWSRAQAAYVVPYYSVEKPSVKAYLSYELESEERTGSFTDSDKDTTTAREKFEIKTKGWIYHPALMIFTVDLKPEFKQQDIDNNVGSDQGKDADFFGYYLDTTILQYKPYTINLFASNARSDFTSSLAPDTVTESTTYRGQLLLKYEPLPTSFTVESKDQVTESFFITSEKSEKFRIDSKHQTSRSKTKLEAELYDQTRNIRDTELTGERNFIYVNNQYRPGDASDLTTGLRFTDNTSGAVDSSTTLFSSQLLVRHREKLKTQYQVRIEDREEGGFMSEKRYGAAEVRHQLYENLTTTLDGNIDNNKFTEGDLDTYTVGVDFRYIRKIPWGKLNINLGHRERVEDDERQLAFAEVRDESHVLPGLELVQLLNNVIDVSSIVVTDIVGFPYVRNIDYIVTAVGTSVFISRNAAGGIADGEQVLVDYRYEANPPAKIATDMNSFGINLDLWSKLKLYYHRNRSNEEFISGIEPPELQKNLVQRTGAELRLAWSTTKVEVEDRDTTQTPTKWFRFSEAILLRPSRNMSLSFVADYSELDLVDTDDSSDGTAFSINFRWDLRRAGQFSFDAFSQRIKGTAQRSETEGLKALYQWNYGAWRPSIRYTFVDEIDQLVNQTRKRNNLLFEISRDFQ